MLWLLCFTPQSQFIKLFQILKSWDMSTSWEAAWCVSPSKFLVCKFLKVSRKPYTFLKILPCRAMEWGVTLILVSAFEGILSKDSSVSPCTTLLPSNTWCHTIIRQYRNVTKALHCSVLEPTIFPMMVIDSLQFLLHFKRILENIWKRYQGGYEQSF